MRLYTPDLLIPIRLATVAMEFEIVSLACVDVCMLPILWCDTCPQVVSTSLDLPPLETHCRNVRESSRLNALPEEISASAAVCGPLLHHFTTLLQQIATLVGRFHLTPDGMR